MQMHMQSESESLSTINSRERGGANAPSPPVPQVEKSSPQSLSAKDPPSKANGGARLPRVRRGTRIPDDWIMPQAYREWVQAHCGLTNTQIETERIKFYNYWSAKSGKDATKLDWFKTWQNWILRAEEYAKNQSAGSRESFAERATRKSAQWAREQSGG